MLATVSLLSRLGATSLLVSRPVATPVLLAGFKTLTPLFADAKKGKAAATPPVKKILTPEQKAKQQEAKEKARQREAEKKEAEKEKRAEKREKDAAKRAKLEQAEKEKKQKQKEKARSQKEKEDAKLQQVKEKKKQDRAVAKARPRRALSAYFFYVKEHISPTMKANGLTGFGASAKAIKEISTKWNALSADQKSKYEKLSAQDKTRVQKELEKFKKEHPDPPKKLRNAFSYFIQNFAQNNNKLKTIAELGKNASAKWKTLPAAEKKKYTTLAEKDKERYLKEKEAWAKKAEA